MRSRHTEFVTFFKFRRFFWKSQTFTDLLDFNCIFVMVIMLVVAVTVVTMLLAMLEAMLEGAKSAQGHSAECSVLCQPGWGGDHAPAA